MAYNSPSCVADLGNTGLSNCLDELTYTSRLIWTVESFEFADEASAQAEADWEAAINDKNIYPFPAFDEVEPNMEDNQKQDFSTGISLLIREGKYGEKGHFETALCTLPNLRTFNNVKGRAFIVTDNGKVWGTSPDGVKFKGFLLSEFFVGSLKSVDGSTKRMVTLDYQFKNINEMADYPAVPVLTWDPNDLSGIVNVVVAVESSAEGSVVVSVTRLCDNETVDGLVATPGTGDFTMLASDGTTQMLPADDFADNGDGTYTFTFDTPALPADDYTVNLLAPSAQQTGGYESTGSDTFNIPA